jgi:hypothetical protein
MIAWIRLNCICVKSLYGYHTFCLAVRTGSNALVANRYLEMVRIAGRYFSCSIFKPPKKLSKYAHNCAVQLHETYKPRIS